ncbi:MAG: hypothetical protein IJC07_05965 [Clostridia bacterium]|nr:hypothetical protein [Clostridia bacterium]
MKKPDANLFNLISFIALLLIATLMLFGGIFGGSLFGLILETISSALTLLVVGVSAYRFLPGKPTWVKIVYIVSVLVLITGSVIAWIKFL